VGPEAPPPSPQRKSKTSLKKKQDLWIELCQWRQQEIILYWLFLWE
jgi:hypothetical protein